MKIKPILKLLRIHQWLKNTFIFLPIFFAMKITDFDLYYTSIALFLGFSFIASSIYVFNDYFDFEFDKLHPTKKNRPIASGIIKLHEARIIMLVSFLVGATIIVSQIDNYMIYSLVGLYVIQNIFYTIKLKEIAILDITIVSLGFVIRVLLGGEVGHVALSHWIVLMTFILAMFLALAKRSDDMRIMKNSETELRKSMKGYNLEFLNISMGIMAVIVIFTYILYVTSPEIISRLGPNSYLTAFFVIIGVLRYLQISLVLQDSGSPTKILIKDLFLQVLILGWIVSYTLLIYF